MKKTVYMIAGLMVLTIGSIELLPLLRTNAVLPTVMITGRSAFPRQLRDAAGETLTITSPPQRIVSQTLATDEILLAICPLERLVAVSTLAQDATYSNVAVQARKIATFASNNVEQVLALQPDLIFVASYNRAETVELLKTTGVPVFRFANFYSLADIEKNIRTVGYMIGEEQHAESVVAQMERELREIRAAIPKNRPPPRVMSYSFGNYTAGDHTTFDDMLNWVGAINVATEHGIEQEAKISDEQILAWQPEFIVTFAAVNEFAQVRQQLLEHPAIASSQAGRIIVIESRYFMAVSQYIVAGIRALAEGLYDCASGPCTP